MSYIIAIILLAAADQGLKAYVLRNLGMSGHQDLINNLLSFDVIQNNGIAFGMLGHARELIVMITSLLTGAIIVYILLRRRSAGKTVLVSLTMIAGGALGNLIDRVRLGWVTDFIHVHFFPYIFNFADACVVIGCVILLLSLILPSRGYGRGKRRRG